jgi:hypothetical protein
MRNERPAMWGSRGGDPHDAPRVTSGTGGPGRIERLLRWFTGQEHIRDMLPYPRTPSRAYP